MDNWINTIPTTDHPVPDFPFLQIRFDEKKDVVTNSHFIKTTEPALCACLFVAIKYRNADESLESRRVTIRRILLHWSVPTLIVWCHEVNGFRDFRLNRVDSFVTVNGESHINSDFWTSIDIDPVATAHGQVKPAQRRVESLVGPQVRILAALAKGDGHMAYREVSTIADYVISEMEEAGKPLSFNEAEYLENYIGRMRPTQEDVRNAVEKLIGGRFNHKLRLNSRRATNFFGAANAIIDASGDFQDMAVDFIAELKAHT